MIDSSLSQSLWFKNWKFPLTLSFMPPSLALPLGGGRVWVGRGNALIIPLPLEGGGLGWGWLGLPPPRGREGSLHCLTDLETPEPRPVSLPPGSAASPSPLKGEG